MKTISKVREEIKVGDIVLTNGDGRDRTIPSLLKGVVGEKGKKFFYLFHNNPQYAGQIHNVNPADFGYRYSWCIGLDNPLASIGRIGKFQSPTLMETLESSEEENCTESCKPESCDMPCEEEKTFYSKPTFKTTFLKGEPEKNPNMSIYHRLSVAVRKFLNESLKAQVEAGFRNEDLSLSGEGRQELLEILADLHSDALAARAKEVTAEHKARRKEERDEE